MARDEALRNNQAEESLPAGTLAENLQVNYATSEAMLRVHQSHEIKRRVNERSVVFFSTNETSFTALNLAFTTQMGLHESTQALNAMTEGTQGPGSGGQHWR